jgi:hypothetical protein
VLHEGRRLEGQTKRKKYRQSGRQTDRRKGMTKLIVACCNFANALKNDVTSTGLGRKS